MDEKESESSRIEDNSTTCAQVPIKEVAFARCKRRNQRSYDEMKNKSGICLSNIFPKLDKST